MTIEAKYGIPTVALHTDKFDKVVESVARVNGMPGLRQVLGGESNGYWRIMGCNYQKTVSVDEWR